jgi:hypothetical protein
MTLQSILELILGVSVLVIAWFLRQLHSDFKNYITEVKDVKEEQNKLLNKVLLQEQKSKADYEFLNQMTNEKLGTITIHISDMSRTLQDLSKTLIHLDKNQQVISTVLDRFMKLEDRIIELERA